MSRRRPTFTSRWRTNTASRWTATTIKLPNVAPDEGLSAPFNGWMTFFGQFFDHGLDLISKGGNGTIYVPLQPDDPLYVPGGSTNFMVLTRACHPVRPGRRRRRRARHRRRHSREADQRHHSVRRPEPDLHLASLAPGVPARVRDGRRQAAARPGACSTARTAACRPGRTSRTQARENCSAST